LLHGVSGQETLRVPQCKPPCEPDEHADEDGQRGARLAAVIVDMPFVQMW